MTTHDSFTVSRVFEHPRAVVLSLFADDAVWPRWFRMPDGRVEHLENNATYFAIDELSVVFAYEVVSDSAGGCPRQRDGLLHGG